jgi:hypothetical protein
MAHPLHDLADDRPTDATAQGLMDLPNTHSRGAGEGFHTGDDVGRRARTAEPLATDLRRGPATGRGVRHPGGGQPPEPVSQRASQTVWAIRAGYDDTTGAFRAKNTLWHACMRPSREKLHVLCTYPVNTALHVVHCIRQMVTPPRRTRTSWEWRVRHPPPPQVALWVS